MESPPTGKVNPRPIVVAHLATLVDATTEKVRFTDYVVLYALPIGVAAVAAWRVSDLKIGEGLAAALLAVAGLFGAFLFQLSIQLMNQAATWADTQPTPSSTTSRYANLMGGLAANTAYACLVSIISAAVLIAAAVSVDGVGETAIVAVAIGLLVHLGLTLLMILRRVFLLSQMRLLAARTGASVPGGGRKAA